MSRRYVVEDDGALLTALAGRVDSLERAHRGVVTEVSTIRRAVTDLTGAITKRSGGGRPGVVDEEQPDWFAVTDIDLARTWLAEVDRGRRGVLARHGVIVTAGCWAVHPDVVACLLALLTERTAAYTGDRPTAVVDWLTRWAPAIATRIDVALAGCLAERAHLENKRSYDARDLDLDLASVAAWWALDRHIPAPEAFALPVIR